MSELKWIVKSVEARDDYSLLLTFADGSIKLFDVKPLLVEKINEPLKDLDFFLTAKVMHHTVGWNDELDLCPEYLYDNSVEC